MTDVELQVTDSFERVFPVPVVDADWDDVLDRAGAGRRHRTWTLPPWRVVAVAAVILVGGLLVSSAFGIGSRLLDLVRGGPSGRSPSGELEVQTLVWSPDGRKVAFSSRRDGNFEVYVVNADGSGLRNLTQKLPGGFFGPGLSDPGWSPDGRKIAFVRFDAGRGIYLGIYVVKPDGSGLRRLTRNPAGDGAPAWSPDGRKIAFESRRDGDFDVYIMNADGSGQRRLTHRGA